MDKLSSILPNSPRVKSVDLTEAKPRRPGTPSFGVPMGSTSSMRDRVSINGPHLEEEPVYRNPKEARSVKLVEEATKSFFDTRLNNDAKRIFAEDEAPLRTSDAVAEEISDSLLEKPAANAPRMPMTPAKFDVMA